MKINVKEILTLPTYIMLGISLASGIILFFPEIIIRKMYMFDYRESHGFIIGSIFILFTAILFINLLFNIGKSFSNAKARKEFYEKAEERLNALTDYQKSIVYSLYRKDNRTMFLPLNDGAVSELNYKGVIGLVRGGDHIIDVRGPAVPYLLQPWVSDELIDKPMLLANFKESAGQYVDKNRI